MLELNNSNFETVKRPDTFTAPEWEELMKDCRQFAERAQFVIEMNPRDPVNTYSFKLSSNGNRKRVPGDLQSPG